MTTDSQINNPVECVTCAGTGWVCEDHNDKPWSGGMPDDFVGCCDGAGAPCPICNPCDDKTPPRELTCSTTVWDIKHGWRH